MNASFPAQVEAAANYLSDHGKKSFGPTNMICHVQMLKAKGLTRRETLIERHTPKTNSRAKKIWALIDWCSAKIKSLF